MGDEEIGQVESSLTQSDNDDEQAEAATEQPPQHVRTLGKLRFRPADDDEPRYGLMKLNLMLVLISRTGTGGLPRRRSH